jgi:hypothetical protein
VGNYDMGFVLILTESDQISDWIRNYFVSVDCIAERCYCCLVGCRFGGKGVENWERLPFAVGTVRGYVGNEMVRSRRNYCLSDFICCCNDTILKFELIY